MRRELHKHINGAVKASWGLLPSPWGVVAAGPLPGILPPPTGEKWGGPTAPKTRLPAGGTRPGTASSPRASASFWSGSQDLLFSMTFPKVPQEAGQLFTANTGSRAGTRRVPFLLEAGEKDLSGLKRVCCFFPKKSAWGRRTWEQSPPVHPWLFFSPLKTMQQ